MLGIGWSFYEVWSGLEVSCHMTLALLAELGCCFVIEIIVGVYAFVLDIDMAPGSCVNIL